MTEQEKREKAIDEMAKDIPEKIKVMFSQTDYILLSEYLRKNISMALIKKGYRKVDKDSVFHIDISEEFAKECKGEIEKAYKEGYTDGIEVPLKELREQMKDDILRKEEEVRKETIIKVAKWLNGRVNTDVIWFLLRKFGVEVEG